MKRFLFVALAAMVALTGCNLESALLYGQMTMGQVQNSNIITDDGLTYVVTENESDASYTSLDRILISCDVLEKLDEENTYSIRLLDYAAVTVSEPVAKTSESEEWFGDDGVNLTSGWLGGGYLNVYATISMLQSSKTQHRVRLMFDDTADNSDTLHFYLKHNGFGETFDDDPDNTGIGSYSTYLSFPINSFVPSDAKGINLKVEWDWFKTQNNQYITEKEHYYQTVYYQVSGTRADF